jgi:hypothetical protein
VERGQTVEPDAVTEVGLWLAGLNVEPSSPVKVTLWLVPGSVLVLRAFVWGDGDWVLLTNSVKRLQSPHTGDGGI